MGIFYDMAGFSPFHLIPPESRLPEKGHKKARKRLIYGLCELPLLDLNQRHCG